MCIQDNRMDRGDRLQHELFSFVIEEIFDFDYEHAHPELVELMKTRKLIVELMAIDGWRLVETVKNSAADKIGMDLIFINLKDDRYFIIDVTLDPKCKEGLPYLRVDSVFAIDVNEDDRLDIESKQRFLDVLLDLMTSPSVFSVKEMPPPNYTSKLSFLHVAEELENFRKQLDARVAKLQREVLLEDASPALGREAEQIHEYSVSLARVIAFAKAEHVRESDLEYQARVEHFAGQMRSALFETVRNYLGLPNSNLRTSDSQSTHGLTYDKKLDRLALRVDDYDTPFLLYRVTSLVGEVVKLVCERNKPSSTCFWTARRELEHPAARVKVITDAIAIIHSTKVHTLLGVPEKLHKTKTALRKEARKQREKAQAA